LDRLNLDLDVLGRLLVVAVLEVEQPIEPHLRLVLRQLRLVLEDVQVEEPEEDALPVRLLAHDDVHRVPLGE
jgi:hypothetical protein